jgi:hypothetical protein
LGSRSTTPVLRDERIPLVEARAKAREWTEAAACGIDPKEEARKAKLAEEGRMIFGDVTKRYIARHVSKLSKARDTEREMRKELMSRFKDKALADVTRRDIAACASAAR